MAALLRVDADPLDWQIVVGAERGEGSKLCGNNLSKKKKRLAVKTFRLLKSQVCCCFFWWPIKCGWLATDIDG